jgi:hypothetical protein
MNKNDNIKHDPDECGHYFNCGEDWDCDCKDEYGCEECNDELESEESVAGGLGFYISDDGHWVPKGM